MRKSPVHLFWLSADNREEGRLVFATTEASAVHRFGPELSGNAATVKSRLVVSGVTLFRVVCSGFMPRQADIVELRALEFEVSESQTGDRVSRLGDEVFVDAFSLHVVMAEHERERINAEDPDYGRNV